MKLDPFIDNVEGAVLVKLWRKILEEKGYINRLDNMVARYENESNRLKHIKNVKRKAKHSIIKYVTGSTMTIKILLYLLYHFVGAKNVKITVTLTFPNGEVSSHEITASREDADEVSSGLNKGTTDGQPL